MTNLNFVGFNGHLGKDPETRVAQSGTAVCHFRIAISQAPVQGKEQETMWFTVKCFGKTAEFAGQNLKKGDGVTVTGRMAYETWQKQDGTKASANVIIAEHVSQDRGSGQSDQTQPHAPAPAPRSAAPPRQAANGAPRVPTVPPASSASDTDDSDFVPF